MCELWPSLQTIHARFNADPEMTSDKVNLLSDATPSSGKNEKDFLDLPPVLNDLFARRAAAEFHLFGPSPQFGQVVLIQDSTGSTPLPFTTVLLDEHITGTQWAGWLVVPDTDYASYWDVLLDHRDEPFDPEAGMIQVWNPVFVAVPVGAKVIAQLTQERLSVVRIVAAEYASADRAIAEAARPGHVAPRSLASGNVAITGTPLGDASDPRRIYQSYYVTAASRLRSSSLASNVIAFPGGAKRHHIRGEKEEGMAAAALVGRWMGTGDIEQKDGRFSPALIVSLIINVMLLIAIVILLATTQPVG